jgi:hypothetical protein
MFRETLLLWNRYINSINASGGSKCIAAYNYRDLVDFICNSTSSSVKETVEWVRGTRKTIKWSSTRIKASSHPQTRQHTICKALLSLFHLCDLQATNGAWFTRYRFPRDQETWKSMSIYLCLWLGSILMSRISGLM